VTERYRFARRASKILEDKSGEKSETDGCQRAVRPFQSMRLTFVSEEQDKDARRKIHGGGS